MDEDSLLKNRVFGIKPQPKTCRGRTITWFTNMNHGMCQRILLYLLFVLYVAAHLIAFVLVLRHALRHPGSTSLFEVILPLLLLCFFTVLVVPIVIFFLIHDLSVRREGIMLWQRDALFTLVLRWFFAILFMSTLLIYYKCEEAENEYTSGQCWGLSLIPMAFPFVCLLFKLIFIKHQLFILWSAFIICLFTQIIVLLTVKAPFRSSASQDLQYWIGQMVVQAGDQNDSHPYAQTWCLFIPTMLFFILCDIEAIYQIYDYKPRAFKQYIAFSKELFYVFGVLSLICSFIVIGFSYKAFTGPFLDDQYVKLFCDLLILKACFASFFLAIEFYDMLFEQIYVDVNHLLNPVRPITSQRIAAKNQNTDNDPCPTEDQTEIQGTPPLEIKPQFSSKLGKTDPYSADDMEMEGESPVNPIGEESDEDTSMRQKSELNLTDAEARAETNLARQQQIYQQPNQQPTFFQSINYGD